LTALLVIAGACTPGGRTRAPEHAQLAAGWIDAETVGQATLADPELLDGLAQAGARGQVLRLDRLLDLYDGARFASDKQARDSLWLALGGYSSARGIDASREVVIRLLDEAFAIEDLAAAQPGALSEDEQRFVADAIMLLSTDMFLPDSADSLITQTLAYRVLAEDGHSRVADNARWRLYDHVRGVLEGAVEIGPELRADLLVHALYAEREDISIWLEDLAPHAQPPLPSATSVWDLLDEQRTILAAIPRWQAVLAGRAQREAELRETVMALLPRPRDLNWVVPSQPRGVARRESLAPVVLLRPGTTSLEPSAADPREFASGASGPDLVAAIEGLLVRDGRGTLLLAADPQTPAPEYAAALAAMVGARAATLELAVLEPRIPSDANDDLGDSVIVALPLHVARPDDLGPGARALRNARIHVQLAGRGPRVRVDGRWLSTVSPLPSDLAQFIAELRRAYPRERVVSLAIASDVQHGQVVDLLAVLSGGIDPAFFAVGWMPDALIEAEVIGNADADRILAARAKLAADKPAITVRELETLPEDERVRVEQAMAGVRECVPELEGPLPKAGVVLAFEFDDGQLVKLSASGRRVDAGALARLEGCVRERVLGFRLRTVTEAVTLSLVIGGL